MRRRIGWIVLVAIVVAGAAFAYSFSQTPGYTASSTLLLEPATANASSADPVDIATDAALVSSPQLMSAVAASLHLGTVPPASASTPGTNNLITVSVSSSSPAKAALFANRYSKLFVDTLAAQQRLAYKTAEQSIIGQISSLETQEVPYEKASRVAPGHQSTLPQQVAAQELLSLQNRVTGLEGDYAQLAVQEAEPGGGVRLVSAASAPSSPSSPKTLRNVALGLVVGLILGVILAFVIDAFDDSIKSKEDIERAYPRLPSLGVIPSVDTWRTADFPYVVSTEAPLSQATEAYRSLRTAIEFSRINKTMRSIMVTSSMDFEGKTSTAANLGVIFAKTGQRTLVVSADLRRPRLGKFFALSDEVGLTSLALGTATYDEAIVPVDEVPGLYYLGTGPLPWEAAEFLGSRTVEGIFDELRERFDVVLIDSPPTVLVTDAMIMSRYVDGVAIVVAHGRTRRRSLERMRELCVQVNAPVMGTILNGVATKGADAYGYGYGSTYRYGYGKARAYGAESQVKPRNFAKRGAKSGPHQMAPRTQLGFDVESERTGS